ncbi:MAG: hypothetical protein ACYC99_03055 [Candidatus Geothermincolia bacterium]
MYQADSEQMNTLKGLIKILEEELPAIVHARSLSKSSKIPFKAVSMRDTTHHRITDLAEIAQDLFAEGKTVAAIILTRSIIESVSLFYLLVKKMKTVVTTNSIEGFDSFMMSALLGCRDKSRPREAINALTAIDHVDRKYQGMREIYDYLCEIAHPNWDGTSYSYGSLEPHNDLMRLSSKYQEKIRNGLPALVGALALFMECHNEFEELKVPFTDICEANIGLTT